MLHISRSVYLWHQADWQALCERLSHFSNNFISNYCVDTPIQELWNTFKQELVPSKLLSRPPRHPWIKTIKCLSNKKKIPPLSRSYPDITPLLIEASGVRFNLDPSNAQGPDGISARFLKETIAPILTLLFNASLYGTVHLQLHTRVAFCLCATLILRMTNSTATR